MDKKSLQLKQVFLHIGLPRTATSFLQSKIFPFITGIYYFGHADLKTQNTPFILLEELNKQNILQIKNEILDYANTLEEKNILFSSELLVGLPNYLLNARAIKEIFREPKIIFVIRKQADWAESLYNWHMTEHVKFFLDNNPADQSCICGIKEYCRRFDLRNLNWHKMAKDYAEIFGKENVLILPYELLKEDLSEFMSRFYEFTGFTPYHPENIELINPSASLTSVKYSPCLSRYNDLIKDIPDGFLKKFIQKNDRGLKNILSKYTRDFDISGEKLTLEEKNNIMSYHKDSNKKISDLAGIDLKQYGYY